MRVRPKLCECVCGSFSIIHPQNLPAAEVLCSERGLYCSCGTVVLADCVPYFSICLFLYRLLKIHGSPRHLIVILLQQMLRVTLNNVAVGVAASCWRCEWNQKNSLIGFSRGLIPETRLRIL